MRRGVKGGNQYDYTKPAPAPLIPRQDIFELAERVDRSGAVLVPLDEQDVRRVAERIRAAEPAFEAVAINLMWSFLNSSHEERVAEILADELPGVYISRSSEVVPQIRV
jgi:N-methylhydantoinase A